MLSKARTLVICTLLLPKDSYVHRPLTTRPMQPISAYSAWWAGGFARSSFELELDQLFKHLHFHHSLMQRELKEPDFYTIIMLKQKEHPFNDFLRQRLEEEHFDIPVKLIQEENPNEYYQLVQYKSFARLNGEEVNLSDGGLVDWTQKLIPNKKHRLFISATGIELIHKLFQ